MKRILFIILLFIFSGIIYSFNLQKTVYFNQSDIRFYKYNGNDMIDLKGCIHYNKPGYPMLPIMPAKILLPQGAKVKDVIIINVQTTDLEGNYLIQPACKPYIKSKEEAVEIIPVKEVYESNNLFPKNYLEFTGQGSKDGFNIANIIIYPVQYTGLSGMLRFANSITFNIKYDNNPEMIREEHKNVINSTKDIISRIVVNPEDISSFQPIKRILFRSKALNPDTIDYVIITTSEFVSYMEPLINWKTQKGIPAKTVTLDFIYANYPGIDNPDKIRNFIKDAHNIWGTMYVVMGGQYDYEHGEEVVPRRNLMCDMVPPYIFDSFIPSNLYFSNLDGNWDYNENGLYGEDSDSVDMYSDVYVGRAPFKNIIQAQTFVNKSISYEKSSSQGYITSIILPGCWNYVNDVIEGISPLSWTKYKFCEINGTLNRNAIYNALNIGASFIHHDAHGNQMGILNSSGEIVTYYADIDSLTNKNKLGIYFSGACLCGAADYGGGDNDCFAEHVINNPNGAGIIALYNSRIAFGGTPVFNTDAIDTLYFYEIMKNHINTHGEAIALTRDYFAPFISSKSTQNIHMRRSLYEKYTFGDPEIHPFTNEIGYLNLIFPKYYFIGSGSINIEVKDKFNNSSINKARVCMMKDSIFYIRGLTDISGNISFNPQIDSTGNYLLTVTSNNYYPVEETIHVKLNDKAYIGYLNSHIIGDDNGNGSINPGESINLSVTLKNYGILNANNVFALFSSNDTFVNITSDSIFFGIINAGDSIQSTDSYTFSVSNNIPNNHIIQFILNIKDSLNNVWNDKFSVLTSSPSILFESAEINDEVTGNADNKWDKGEQVNLIFTIKNCGNEIAKNVNLLFSTDAEGIVINDSTTLYGDIDTGNITQNTSDILSAVSSDSIDFGAHILINYTISGDNVATFNDTVTLYAGYKDYIIFDVDSNHSSGYIMDSALINLGHNGDYSINFEDYICNLIKYKSIFIFAGISSNNTVLDLASGYGSIIYDWCKNNKGNLYIEGGDIWCRDPFYNYGFNFNNMFGISPQMDGYGDLSIIQGVNTTFTDGMSFSYIGENNLIDRIAPIDSSISIFSNSSPSYCCGVANDAGDYKTVGLSFEFGGLENSGGISVKDTLALKIMNFFNVKPYQGIAIGNSKIAHKYRDIEFGIRIKNTNIFNKEINIEYSVIKNSKVVINIYNMSGQLINRLVNEYVSSGYHKIIWKGIDSKCKNVKNGIYFIRIKSGNKSQTIKTVLIR